EVNPEYPIVESPAKPFLMSFPMTNVSEVTEGNTTYKAGTVWEYDLHAYPKDQTTTVIKRIIDPDETEAEATFRTNEDYQMGEIIKQVIIADAPALQKAYELLPAEQNGTATTQPAVTHKTYKITDTMTEGYHFKSVTKVVLGAKRAQVPTENSYFAEGFAELTECEYKTNGDPVANSGDFFVTGKDGDHAFTVTMTDSGLARLDALTVDSQVAVFFEADLDSAAKIGTDDNYLKKGNMNLPTLTWRNSNTLERSVDGNRVYVYTYELDITKTGLTDLTQATFIVSRKESASSSTPLSFVKESDGVYHIYDANGLDQSLAAAKILSEIHPDAAGKLHIKGFDSKTYTFKETATQGGFELLKETFDVTFNEETTTRDGELTNAVLSVDGASDDLDIDKGEGGNGGLVKVTIENHKTVTLRTGGEGRLLVIGVGTAGIVGLLA
ncbi:MAG: SpaA isopeptide-forming pilin-related protein, partial [Lachnospiraceae bacterium]